MGRPSTVGTNAAPQRAAQVISADGSPCKYWLPARIAERSCWDFIELSEVDDGLLHVVPDSETIDHEPRRLRLSVHADQLKTERSELKRQELPLLASGSSVEYD